MTLHYTLQVQYHQIFMALFAVACRDITECDVLLKLTIPAFTNKTVLEIRTTGDNPRVVILDFDNIEKNKCFSIEYYSNAEVADAWLIGDYERSETGRMVRKYILDPNRFNLNSVEAITGRAVAPILRFLKTGMPFVMG